MNTIYVQEVKCLNIVYSRNMKNCIAGSYDFLGMNFYTSNVVTYKPSTGQSYSADGDIDITKDPEWLG